MSTSGLLAARFAEPCLREALTPRWRNMRVRSAAKKEEPFRPVAHVFTMPARSPSPWAIEPAVTPSGPLPSAVAAREEGALLRAERRQAGIDLLLDQAGT